MVAFLHVTINKMATYAPRTLLRLFNDDKTAHTTGVVLKDGSVYDTKFRSTHSSIDEWRSNSVSFTGELTVDASKAMGVVITETHGFTYPSLNPYADWVFDILSELAPHLLANEAVRNAHQKFIDACKKPEVVIRMYGSYFFTGERKYRATLLNTCDQLYRLPFAYYTTYAYEKRNMESIQTAYMELRNLIADDLLPPLKEKEEHYQKLAGKRLLTRWMKMHERRIKKYAKIIKESQDYIEEYKRKLEN
jgi:hypothetical protein